MSSQAASPKERNRGMRIFNQTVAMLLAGASAITPLSLVSGFLITIAPRTAHAETPVDQCGNGSTAPSAPAASGTGFSPGKNLGNPAESSSGTTEGSVDPSTGSYNYSSEDLALGTGAFPAKLALVRTYSSVQDGPDGAEVIGASPYAPGSQQWFAFGRGATHNLDITFDTVLQSIGGRKYSVIVIRAGFQTEAFQECSAGVYVSSGGNGSRLYPDSTYSAGGLRYESRDGTIALFQRLPAQTGNGYSCGKTVLYPIYCGVLRKWTDVNGDSAQFNYQQYYSHPTNRAEPTSSGATISNPEYGSQLQECHADFDAVVECHGTRFGTYYTTSAQFYSAIFSYPVYHWRLTDVSNSRGYKLSFTYVDASTDVGGPCPPTGDGSLNSCTPPKNVGLGRNRLASVAGAWISPTGQQTALGQSIYAYENCNGWASDCLSSVQKADGAVTRYVNTFVSGPGYNDRQIAIFAPGDATARETVRLTRARKSYYYPDRLRGYYSGFPPKYNQHYWIAQTRTLADGGVYQYIPTIAHKWVPDPYGAWDWTDIVGSMKIVAPGGGTTIHDFIDQTDVHSSPVKVTDALQRETSFTYNSVGAPLATIYPEGNRLEYTYDVRGNLLTSVKRPKPGSPLPVLTETHTFVTGATIAASACPNQRLCNKLLNKVDARNSQTDFTWEAASGLPLTETRPADANGVRPTTTYAYGNFAGANASTVRLPASKTERIDATQNAVASFAYGSDYRLTNKQVVVSADGQSLRSCYGYDAHGRKISETTPNANLTVCP